MAHLGFEPQTAFHAQPRTRAGRLLYTLVLDTVEDVNSMSVPAGSYMQLAVYDLLGALFAPTDRTSASFHANRLYRRICNIIKGEFANPAFGPREVAAEAGIRLRYLQKLFSAQDSTCSHFIESVRLDHAAQLLHRRELLRTCQPLSEIANAWALPTMRISPADSAAGSVTPPAPIRDKRLKQDRNSDDSGRSSSRAPMATIASFGQVGPGGSRHPSSCPPDALVGRTSALGHKQAWFRRARHVSCTTV
jgi:AraC-like DNA-binding protein